MNIAQHILVEMLEGDLETAQEAVKAENFDMAAVCYRDAAEKCEQIRDAADPEPPQPKQIGLF